MSRNDRRLLKKAIGRHVFQHPVAKRIARNVKRHGDAASEVYRLDGGTPDEHLYFDVFSMRQWAVANAELVSIVMDWDRARRLVETGAVDPARIADYTIRNELQPVIVGRHAAGPGDDQLLDGAHRYVALAMGAATMGMTGQALPVPAYILQPDEWGAFLIPNFIAKALRFDDGYD